MQEQSPPHEVFIGKLKVMTHRKKVVIKESDLKELVNENVERWINGYQNSGIYLRRPYLDISDDIDRFIRAIKDGEYDDKIKDQEWVNNAVEEFEDDAQHNLDIYDAVGDRLLLIDKDFALKNGGWYNPCTVLGQKKRPLHRNRNTYLNGGYTDRVLGRKGYRDSEIENGWNRAAIDRMKHERPGDYNALFKKNGGARKTSAALRNLKNNILYTSADERPLHRKGSANRDLMDMDRKKKITESQLRSIVRNSVKRALMEAGNLYGHYDDGTVFTNSKETWRGVPGTVYIWHGEWSDPEILYQGKELNATDVESVLWENYKEDCREYRKEPNEDEFDKLPVTWFKQELDDYMYYAFSPDL